MKVNKGDLVKLKSTDPVSDRFRGLVVLVTAVENCLDDLRVLIDGKEYNASFGSIEAVLYES